MTHTIPFVLLNNSLPVPHFLGFPDYTQQKTYDIIVPKDLSIQEGDNVIMFNMITKASRVHIIAEIIKRRPAKGDWSSQKDHKQPDFIRYISK